MDEDGRDLDPAEEERIRRRDRRMTEEERALLQPGAAKLYKQILDRQAKAARETPPPAKRRPGSRGR